MKLFIVCTAFALFIASEIPAACADEDATQKEIKTELAAQAQALGKMLRQDVEDVRVLIEQVANVSLPVTGGEVAPPQQGVVIPIIMEGRNAGNVTEWYLAAYIVMKPNKQFLQDMGGANNTHKHVALVGFGQINSSRWIDLNWEARQVFRGVIVIPACRVQRDITKCPIDAEGNVVVKLDGNIFGPTFAIEQ